MEPRNEWSNERKQWTPSSRKQEGWTGTRGATPASERASRDDAKLSGKSSAGSGLPTACSAASSFVGSAGKGGMGDVKQRLQKVGLGRDASVGQNVLSKRAAGGTFFFFLEGFEGSRVCSYTDNPSLGLGRFSTLTQSPPLTLQVRVWPVRSSLPLRLHLPHGRRETGGSRCCLP